MIGVQIYYTVYDRRTRVLYAVAVAVAEYAVAVAEFVASEVALFDTQYYVLHNMVHNMVHNTLQLCCNSK